MYGPDRTKILCESSWISPERTMTMGYHFKYGSLISALDNLMIDTPSLINIIYSNVSEKWLRFCNWMKEWYIYQEFVVVRKWKASEILLRYVAMITTSACVFLALVWGMNQGSVENLFGFSKY